MYIIISLLGTYTGHVKWLWFIHILYCVALIHTACPEKYNSFPSEFFLNLIFEEKNIEKLCGPHRINNLTKKKFIISLLNNFK